MRPELWSRWIDLYRSFVERGLNVAAPFSPHVPLEFNNPSQRKTRILYLGKATRGECDRNRFDIALEQDIKLARIQSECFSRSIFEMSNAKSGPNFWGFANDLSRAINPLAEDLGNLAWSNVCKIGAISGNPEGTLLIDQIDLAIETLQKEIEDLSPTVVVCVANSYANPILLPVFGDDWEKSETKSELGVENVWWRQHMDNKPAILWMRHPQGSPYEQRDFALKQIVKLSSSL